jgi:glucokinase
MIVLAGDIGGTNIRLALFSADRGLFQSVEEAVYPARNYKSLKMVLQEFMRRVEVKPQAAAFVLAGPVVSDEVEITNLDWIVRKREVIEVLGDVPVEFYNDLAGVSNFVPLLTAQDVLVLNPGNPLEGRAKAVIAPGTGLGEGFLAWSGSEYIVQSSEGGHASFGPESEIQDELLAFMRPRYGHVSYERVCSGSAMPDLYEFMKERESWEEPGWFKQAWDEAEDKAPLIVEAAFESERPIEVCRRVVDLFVEILASEAGNLALKVMATGGVYLGGGIPMKILPALEERFMQSYTAKGRFSDLIATIPVYVIAHPQPALFGAGRFAFRLIGMEIT